MAENKRILIVDDEAPIRELIGFNLTQKGYAYSEAEDASGVWAALAKDRLPDLILLDWMLPGDSGINIAKRLKQQATTKDIPIIMLTARAEEDNKVQGLETGADDYMVKPFSPRELLARIQAVLRRSSGEDDGGNISYEDISLNTHTQLFSYHGRTLKLTPNEFRLLKFFMTHPNRAYSRAQLLDQVWGCDAYLDERSVDAQIKRLRKTLGQRGLDTWVRTVRSVGYLFSAKADV